MERGKCNIESELSLSLIREKSLVTKSEGFFGLKEGENAGIGGGNGI